VEYGDVLVLPGRRMPPEQMVMEEADLSGAVVMADVVKIDLR
jgi:hypothetical protein